MITTIVSLLLTLLIFAIIGQWLLASKAKEIAILVAKKICEKRSLQFLDGTTQFQKMIIMRDENGRAGLARFYYFDYFDGQNRYQGRILIFKNNVCDYELDKRSPGRRQDNQALWSSANDLKHHRDNVIPFPKKKHDDK